jgi:hypothetical protein
MNPLKRIARNLSITVPLCIEAVLSRLLPHTCKKLDLAAGAARLNQLLLMRYYAAISEGRRPPCRFSDVEFRCYSQNGEDGILLYIFSVIGAGNRRCVEIAAGDGIECNTANLVINHGWLGLMVDGDPVRIKRGMAFYRNCRDTFAWPPVLINAWVTSDTVDTLIKEHGFEGEIDLLSLDLDGIDFWIWKAIECVRPRVVVLEYNHLWGPDKSVTVPNEPAFRAQFSHYGSDYAGASLAAFVKLGKAKGYRLIGCQTLGTNAFFMREGVGEKFFPEVPTSQCFLHPRAVFGMKNRLPKVLDREWIEV